MPDTKNFLFRRKKIVLAAALGLFVLITIAAPRLFSSNEPIEGRPVQETIGWPIRGFFGSAASAALYRLGVPAESSDPAPIEVDPVDGNKPTFVSTSFLSKSSFGEIKAFYENSCQELGLQVLPPERAPSWIPELYCDGHYKGQSVSVALAVDCNDGICELFLEVTGI